MSSDAAAPLPSRRVVLLDSSGPLHRCFHGYAEERLGVVDKKRMDVAAVYGYCEYVRKLTRELEFDVLVHVLDPEGGSHARLQMYPDYKAQRDPTHPLLVAQKALLPRVLTAFGHTCIQRRGVESDDIIATLARKYAAQGDEVLVISQDKDLMQLVEDGRIVLARYAAASPGDRRGHEFYEEAEVIKKLGVRPDQVPDFLALVGDSVDNIPGVFRVGEKTAAELLERFGSLAAVMTNHAEIKGALGKNIAAALPNLPLYRRLTQVIDTIDIDCPPPPPPPDPAAAAEARAILSTPNWPDDLNGDLLPQPAARAPASAPAAPASSVAVPTLVAAPEEDGALDTAADLFAAPAPTRGPKM